MTVTINKWGNSLGIRIPKNIAEQANLEAGSELVISLNEKGQLILKAEEKLTLADLCANVTPENRHDLAIDNELGKEKWIY